MNVSGGLHAPAVLLLQNNPSKHWTRGCVGSRVVLDFLRREKLPVSAGIPTPYHPTCSPVSIATTQSRLLVTEEVFKDYETKELWLNPVM